MKLKDKETGAILDDCKISLKNKWGAMAFDQPKTLKELVERFEDVEEQKGYWYINEFGTPTEITHTRENIYDTQRKNFGNYFETKEEAEKAVEKLKAWKRLKDKGVDFYGWRKNHTGTYDFLARWKEVPPKMHDIIDDLDLLFGGEE